MIRLLPFIAQILFAVLVFQDSKERGMNYWLWAGIVFLVPIIGIIFYFIQRKPKMWK